MLPGHTLKEKSARLGLSKRRLTHNKYHFPYLNLTCSLSQLFGHYSLYLHLRIAARTCHPQLLDWNSTVTRPPIIMPFWDREASEKKLDHVSEGSPDYHDIVTTENGEIAENTDNLHRRLNNRQIQLIAIGGSIGTALFVSIGTGLHRGGPGSLLIAYIIQSVMLGFVNNCIAEMTILYPVSGGFIRLAGKFVDEALSFMAGWNFFLYEALLIPFEITALTTVLGYWSDNVPPWSIPLACIVSAQTNVYVVRES